MTNQREIQSAFRDLFDVWRGTENADDILQDAARTIGFQVFDLEGPELNRFEALCRSDETELNGAASPSAG